MSSFIDWLVERRVAEAQAQGSLDDLPGAGRPIEPSALSADPFAKALTESGAVHPVAELSRRIRAAEERLAGKADGEARRAIRREIADLRTRQAIELEQLRRYG